MGDGIVRLSFVANSSVSESERPLWLAGVTIIVACMFLLLATVYLNFFDKYFSAIVE